MDHFTLKNGAMHAEDVPLSRIADEVGTPVYVYSRATLERHARRILCPRVLEARVFAGRALLERGRRIDGRHHRARAGVG